MLAGVRTAELAAQTTSDALVPWICCQLGAREHYSVPRMLRRAGVLMELITDTWVVPHSSWGRLGPVRMLDRFHQDLSAAPVTAQNSRAAAFEMRKAVSRDRGWNAILERNEWFQEHGLRRLRAIRKMHPGRQHCLFSFSYAARRLFAFAKDQGWTTVLGQIDPGPVEDRLVARLHEDRPELAGKWEPAPPEVLAPLERGDRARRPRDREFRLVSPGSTGRRGAGSENSHRSPRI